MRINSTSVRLNYSLSWNNKGFLGRNYIDTLKKNHIVSYLVQSFFMKNSLKRGLSFSHLCIKNSHITNSISIFLYLFKYKDIVDKFFRKKKLLLSRSYMLYYFFQVFLKKTSVLFLSDFHSLFPKDRFVFKYVIVRKRLFGSSLTANYIIAKLLNRFKLKRIISDLGKNLMKERSKKGVFIMCSGRFDRKERASSFIFSFGKLSLNTLRYKIDYSFREVTLKYGVCGIKVWLLNGSKK